MKKRGNIYIVSAPSGCGKTTIVNKILKTVKGVKRSVSVTTRKSRLGERSKKDYFFVSERAFKKKVHKGYFLEWEKNFGYYYGTPKRKVLCRLEAGEDMILTIDVKGAFQIRKKIPESIMVFIAPPRWEDLRARLKKRATDGNKEIRARLEIAKKEMLHSKKYDYIIVNDRIEKAVDKLRAIIIARRCKIKRRGKRTE